MNLSNDEEKLLQKIKLTNPILNGIISKLSPESNLKYLFKQYLIVFENKNETTDIIGFDSINDFKEQYKSFKRLRLFKDLKEVTEEFNNFIKTEE